MRRQEMDQLIEEHLAAEKAGDPKGCVAAYTADVVHDVVGMPNAVIRGPQAAMERYEWLTANMHIEHMDVNHQWYGEDFCVIEHQCHATVSGELMGIPGNNRGISFRILHVWEFKDGAMSRENVWLDSGAIIEQLTARELARAATA
jgi:ketosteroid isomerase-like protein